METSEIENASMDDIIFEGRNKAYGAYLLRKLYNRHLAAATAIAISLFAFFLTIPLVANLTGNEIIIEAPTKTKPNIMISALVIEIPKKVKPAVTTPPPAAPAQQTKAPSQRYVEYQVQPDALVSTANDNPEVDQLDNREIGISTQPGDPDGLPASLNELGNGNGLGEGSTPGSGLGTEPFIQVEQMPEFKGSLSAFMQKNIRYPQEAQRRGIEGTVVITFVVGPTGEISDIKILKGLGAGLDEEAIRVVQKMPLWKPGRQNGQAVPVRFTLPFRFAMN